MSEVDWFKGKLIKVEKLDNETLEQQCKRICEDLGYDIEDELRYFDNCEEVLLDERHGEYLTYKGELYSIQSKRRDEYEDVFEAYRNEDGTIDFEVKYYNGGCCLNEAIEKSLNKIK